MQMMWPSGLARQLGGAVGHGTSEVAFVATAPDEVADGSSVDAASSCLARRRLLPGAARTTGSRAAKRTEAFMMVMEEGG